MKIDRDKLYPWLAILRAKMMGSGRALKLESHFGSIEKALQASPQEIASVPRFSEEIGRHVQEAARGKFDQEIEKELDWVEKNGVSILLIKDDAYPVPLRHIPAPPCLLYVKGRMYPEDILSFAIVGSRRASDAGRRRAGVIAHELAEAGLTIVSGLAWGVDASAHKGALRNKQGRTIAVMGNGLKIIYPRGHETLSREIVKRGAILSELFYDVAPQGQNFPPRNRIISGLSLGVLIVEAAERSGALITANYALDQGKEIFALPGSVDDEHNLGTNKLIQDSKAKLITSAEDILSELGDKITFYRNELEGKIPRVDIAPAKELPIEIYSTPSPETKRDESISVQEDKPKEPELPPLSEDETTVYQKLTEEPVHIDVLCRDLNWPIARVSSALGLLEFKELVERESGMRFRR